MSKKGRQSPAPDQYEFFIRQACQARAAHFAYLYRQIQIWMQQTCRATYGSLQNSLSRHGPTTRSS